MRQYPVFHFLRSVRTVRLFRPNRARREIAFLWAWNGTACLCAIAVTAASTGCFTAPAEPDGRVCIRVVDTEGRPLKGARVMIEDARGAGIGSGRDIWIPNINPRPVDDYRGDGRGLLEGLVAVPVIFVGIVVVQLPYEACQRMTDPARFSFDAKAGEDGIVRFFPPDKKSAPMGYHVKISDPCSGRTEYVQEPWPKEVVLDTRLVLPPMDFLKNSNVK